jgi:phosphoribosylformylglycinamidine cyclo-ligase
VGVVERAKLLDGSAITPGDVVIGVASSGLHSNGYSLVRKIVFEHAGLGVNDPFPTVAAGGSPADESTTNRPAGEPPVATTVGEVLLRPTTIYARAVRGVLSYYKVKGVVHGIAHITGGGLFENLARILPAGVGVAIDRGSWTVPPVFTWLQKLGDVADEEMYRVFNMGLGLVFIVSPYYAESIQQQLAESGLASWLIGRVVEGDAEVKWT